MTTSQKLNRRSFLKSATLAAGATMLPAIRLSAQQSTQSPAAPAASAQPAPKPNIIFILIDDMGWMDSSTYGSKFYETPNLDRMAAQGMRFTNAYATPLCSPTRATIMTGKYCHRLGFTSAAGHVEKATDARMAKRAQPYAKMITPESSTYLPLEEYTLAEALRDGGYVTAHFGKWHLGAKEEFWAKAQGFNETIGGTGAPGPVGYFSPYYLDNVKDGPDGEHIEDRLAEESLRFIEANKDRPFYLNLWQYSIHGPWQAKKELVEKYTKKADSANPQHNPVYAAMLETMDASLGRILDKLEALDIAQNTVLVFMSDNGGLLASEAGNFHLPPRTPLTSNAPLRGGKGNVYEGGVREPLLVCWPAAVKPGAVCDEVVHAVDFYPTLLEVAGLAPQAGKQLDGESFVPLLKGSGKLKRTEIYCHFPHYTVPDDFVVGAYHNIPATFVRQGDWKLIRLYGEGPDRTIKHELYNLKDDIGEANNLAIQQPEKVNELDALIEAHIKETGALVPMPNPAYVPPVTEWTASDALAIERIDGMLKIKCIGIGGFVDSPSFSMPGPLVVRLRARRPADNESRWQTLPGRPRLTGRNRNSDNYVSHIIFDVPHDGQWHEIDVALPTEAILAQLRLYPGYAPDAMDIEWIRLLPAKVSGQTEVKTRPVVTWQFKTPQ